MQTCLGVPHLVVVVVVATPYLGLAAVAKVAIGEVEAHVWLLALT